MKYLEEYYLPKDYIGEELKNGGYTKNTPRKWTEKEIDWLEMLIKEKFNNKQIDEFLYREQLSVQIKRKRLKKSDGETYNEAHREDKYLHNEMFLKQINPKNVLDLFSGQSFYEGKVNELYTNDIDSKYVTYFSEKAEKLVHKLYYDNWSFDLIDIDTFGSAYDCFDCCIKMAKKGIIITIGEMGHKRFKRLDFVNRHYGVKNMTEYTSQKIVDKIIDIGKRNKKKLEVIYLCDYKNISRVYFKINNLKLTEQWSNEKKQKDLFE